MIPVRHFDQGGYLMMATKNGVVKKTSLDLYANINRSGLIAISLPDGDELVNARHTDGEQDVVLVTRKGMSIRFPRIRRAQHGPEYPGRAGDLACGW